MTNKVNILGTSYSYNETTDKEDTRLCDKDGYCDVYGKSIAIETGHNDKHPDCVSDIEAYRNKVKRHEIIHGYFAEAGLAEYSENEQLVDWIAWQFPRLLGTFLEVGAICVPSIPQPEPECNTRTIEVDGASKTFYEHPDGSWKEEMP